MINTMKYDQLIKDSTLRYLPDIDWRILKAQIKAESNFNPNALSPVGARGLAQFMPKTWDEVKAKLKYPDHVSPHESGWAVPAMAYYMDSLRKQWTAPRPDIDRYCLALASYNAGLGNVLKSQREAGNPNDYASIIASLYKVTGEHSKETVNYVKKILAFYCEYVTG